MNMQESSYCPLFLFFNIKGQSAAPKKPKMSNQTKLFLDKWRRNMVTNANI